MTSKCKHLVILLSLCCFSLQAQVTSNFNSDDEGWKESDINNTTAQTVIYNASGGNPGGYVSVTFPGGQPGYWDAPAKFLGAHCMSSYGLNLKFDLQFSSNTSLAHSTYGDVVLENGTYNLVINLPSFPAQAPAWTSYSFKLDDTAGWKYGSIGGATATAEQIKFVLSNLTKIKINGQYQLAASTVSGLDNVVLENGTLATPPSITNFSPASGIPTVTTVTINGSNFNATAANNVVYFGSVKATVSSASATQLKVVVPAGAMYAPIVVANKTSGLSASTINPFSPVFNNNGDNGGRIIRASLGSVVSFDLDTNLGSSAVGDIDGDGLNDIVVGEGSGGSTAFHKFSVFRNAGVTGTISTASFHPKVSFDLVVSYVKGYVTLADFDGDGKLDVAVSGATVSNAFVSVFHNTSTSGNLSFDAPQDYTGYSYSDGPLTAADMDGDGRPEIVGVFNNSCATGDRLYIFPNRSTPGNIDFCSYVSFGNVYTCGGYVTVGDLNNDKLNDVIVTASSNSVMIFENQSTPGVLAFGAAFSVSTTSSGNAVIADFDNDGLNDIAWPYFNVNSVIIKKNIYTAGPLDATSFGADITLSSPLNSTQDGLAAADFNADGNIDILLVGNTDIALFENTGTGSLSTSFLDGVPFATGGSSSYPVSPIFADFDGDNKQDICLRASNDKKLYLFHNECFPLPVISNITPSSGYAGDIINLTGNFFKTGTTTPAFVVRQGKSLATSSASANTTATFTVPSGSETDRVSLTTHGLTVQGKSFPVKFPTSGPIDNTSFATSVDFDISINVRDALDVADFDDDGKLDVVVADNVARIFKNTHATAGQPVTASSLTQESTTYTTSYNLITLDIDGDGKVDLNNGYGLLQNKSTSGNISFLSGPNGVYTYAGGFNYAASADFNKDGKIDLAVTNGSANIQIYQNQSDSGPFLNNNYLSTFMITATNLTRPTNYGGIVAEDFDGDGYDDLICVNPSTDNITIYINTKQVGNISASSFTLDGNYSVGDNPYNLTADDFDGDGMTDIAITYFNVGIVSVLRNQSSLGDISFAASVDLAAASNGYSIASQDLNGDGKAEIVVIHQPNPGPGSFTVFENKSSLGNINFATGVNFSLTTQGRNPHSLAIADINLDEKPDILIVGSPSGSATNALMVFENKIANGPVITITQQPADASVCDGATATFNTNATGTSNITYQWQFSPNTGIYSDIADGGGYSGATTKSLSVNTTSNFGAGRYRCRISGDLAASVTTNDEGLFINAVPSAPSTTGDSDCVPAALTLSASGGSNGQYRWYTVPTGGTAIAGQTNNTYITPVISTTTNYYAAINNGACESSRTIVTATISPLAKPNINSSKTVTGGAINICEGDDVTLTAPNGFESYSWSNGSSLQQIDITQSVNITLTVTDASGCVSPASDAIDISVNPYPLAIITPSDNVLTASAGDSYQWYSNGDIIPGATSQSYTYSFLEYGVYSVDVTTKGCTTHSSDYVYLITSVDKNQNRIVRIHPNPVTEELYIETNTTVSCRLIDMMGHALSTAKPINERLLSVNMRNVPAGTYILEIESETKSFHRIIKTD